MVKRTIAAIAAGVLLTTWPMARHPLGEGLGAPGLEGPDHLWALWAGMRDGPVVIDTVLLNFPAGMRWVLVDPINLLWFVPGWLLGGPGLGWNAVQVGSLVIIGLAAAVWSRRLDPDDDTAPAIAAIAAITAAPVAGSLLTGMSEAMTMGWLVLALAALHRLGDDRRISAVLLAGVLIGLTAWAGPYTAIYTAFAAPPIVLAVLWKARKSALPRIAAAGGLALLIAAPIIKAVLVDRPKGLPGSDSGMPAVLADPGAAKNLMLGADPVGLIWPTLPIEPIHAVFMGTLLVLLAAIRVRRSLPVVASAGVLMVLGLGFFLQRDGQLWGSTPIALPATWLSLKIEALGRAIRWHRAIIPATILLSAPAALTITAISRRLPARPLVLALLTAGVVGEGLFRAPLTWPRLTFPVAAPQGYDALSEGAILPLPLVRFSAGGPDQLRSPLLLWQTSHGHPLGGNPRQPGAAGRDRAVSAAADAILDGDPDGMEAAASLGFTWVIAQHERDADRLTIKLGPPAHAADGVWAWPTRALPDTP